MVFGGSKSKTGVCRVYTFCRCGTNRGQTRTHLELWLAPQLLQFFLSRTDCRSRTACSSARHALHFWSLCLQSRHTYSLRVFAFPPLLHVFFLSRTDCRSRPTCSSARHAWHFRSRRSQSRIDVYASRVWVSPQRLRLAIRVARHAAVAAALPTTLERHRPLG